MAYYTPRRRSRQFYPGINSIVRHRRAESILQNAAINPRHAPQIHAQPYTGCAQCQRGGISENGWIDSGGQQQKQRRQRSPLCRRTGASGNSCLILGAFARPSSCACKWNQARNGTILYNMPLITAMAKPKISRMPNTNSTCGELASAGIHRVNSHNAAPRPAN